MSRGISKLQKEILKVLEMPHSYRVVGYKIIEIAQKVRPETIKRPNNIFARESTLITDDEWAFDRALLSLERRGLVYRLCGRRSRFWLLKE